MNEVAKLAQEKFSVKGRELPLSKETIKSMVDSFEAILLNINKHITDEDLDNRLSVAFDLPF